MKDAQRERLKFMEIMVTNRFSIEELEFDLPHIVITITDDPDHFPHIPEKNCKGILRIAVWDTEDGINFRSIHNFEAARIPEDKIFNNLHAKKILKFVFNHLKDVLLIVCQCDMGLSRSAATAAALSKILNNDDAGFFQPPYIPNKLIYETILSEYQNMKKDLSL